MDDYDVVIVGAGSTGGVLAARLSENPGRSVVVLEAGPVYASLDEFPASLLDPSDESEVMPGSTHSWELSGTLRTGVHVPIPRGKVIGGSSSINGAYFQRGTQSNFKTWVELGNDAWSWEQVLPYYKRSETDLDLHDELHGTDGPIKVRREPPDRAPEFTGAFTQACRELGFADQPDKNGAGPAGVGPVPLNVYEGRRLSTAITYLLPALERPNLRVIGNAYARKAIFDGDRCVGVEADVDGARKMFRAGEVIFSAGALRSPQLLMLSGIGPAEHLREHGLDVRVDLPGVGSNLTDHPELSFQWTFNGKLPAMPGRGLMTSALNWTAEGSGEVDDVEILPFVSSAADMMKISAAVRNPKQAIAALRNASPKFLIQQAKAMRHPFVVIGLQQPDSRGTVRLASADPARLPLLDWNLFSEERDRLRIREGIRVAAEIFHSSPMRAIGARAVNLGDKDLSSDRRIDEWAFANIFAVGHPSCTCRMGPASDMTAVVDQYGSVHGVTGLRVADTSIFPMIPSRGPNATAVMIGERLSDVIDHGTK